MWCDLLGFLEFAINCAVAEGTRQVPAELTIEELPRSPLDVVVQAGSHAGAGDFVLHIYNVLQRAKAHLLKAQECQNRHQEHEVGDWVLLSTSNLHLATGHKLHQWFVGPFKVLQRVGKTAYKLDLQGCFTGVYNVFHMSKMRHHVPGGSSTEPLQPVEVEGEAHYEVETLLKHRERHGGRQYHVRWTGYCCGKICRAHVGLCVLLNLLRLQPVRLNICTSGPTACTLL